MSMEYIRNYYGVPAKKGGAIEYTGDGTPKNGVITGSDGTYLSIRLEGQKFSRPYHPTWELRYLDTRKEKADE